LALKKKGQVDILTTAIVLFVIAILCLIGFKVINTMAVNYNAMDNVSAPQSTKGAITNYASSIGSGFDQGIVIALGFIFVLTLVFASQINTNPGFFWIFLFILIIVLAVTSILSQVFEQGTNTVGFAAERAAMPMVTWVGTNVFMIAAAMAVLLMVVIFAKINPQE
jgi:hypothetical protein